MGGLNSRNVLSQSSAGWKSEIKVSAGLVSSVALWEESVPGPSLWLVDAHLLPEPSRCLLFVSPSKFSLMRTLVILD